MGALGLVLGRRWILGALIATNGYEMYVCLCLEGLIMLGLAALDQSVIQ